MKKYCEIIDNDKRCSKEEGLKIKLHIINRVFPRLQEHLRETEKLLYDVLLVDKQNIYTINRVYEKSDKNKKAVLFICAKFPENKNVFYYCRREDKGFTRIEQKDFEERFECYQMDIERNNGLKWWEENKSKERDYER